MKFNLIYFIRLFMRHILLIVAVPVVVTFTVFYLTKDVPRTYLSRTTVYTSLATGSSIDLSGFTFNTVNAEFDNLMNVIRSRLTLENTGLILFASHLMLDKADPKIIQENHYNEIMQIVPEEVKKLRVPGNLDSTFANLQRYCVSSGGNFVSNLITNSGSYYDGGAISGKLNVRRIQTSDNIELSYVSNDPGISQLTLFYLVREYSKAYLSNQSNQQNDAVSYFEKEVASASARLQSAEDELQTFNQENKIINYSEQSKFIASRKEQFEMGYQDVLKQNASAKAVIEMLENKMSPEEQRKITSTELLNLRKDLARNNQNLAMESIKDADGNTLAEQSRVKALAQKSYDLKQKMKSLVDSLYQFTNGVGAVPTKNILTDWLSSVIEFEGTKAQIITMDTLRNEFDKTYSKYAPMGATMRRLERKINVAEDEYVTLVRNLGIAKLKQQGVQASSANTIIDPPYFPLNPEPDKRKMSILAATIAGLLLTLFTILAFDLMDSSMRNAERTALQTGLVVESVFPVVSRKKQKIDIAYLKRKGTEVISRKLILHALETPKEKRPITCFVFSTREHEGKSYLLQQISGYLSEIGYRVLIFMSHDVPASENKNYEIARYQTSQDFFRISSLQELDISDFKPEWKNYDFIFVEFPGVINSSFPVNLFKTADLCFLVCRANRSWTRADTNILDEIMAITDPLKPRIILNGVALEEMESVVGELPRKRSWLRRTIKKILTRQFQSGEVA
jgi:polysaccharide biosynthesis transport protein